MSSDTCCCCLEKSSSHRCVQQERVKSHTSNDVKLHMTYIPVHLDTLAVRKQHACSLNSGPRASQLPTKLWKTSEIHFLRNSQQNTLLMPNGLCSYNDKLLLMTWFMQLLTNSYVIFVWIVNFCCSSSLLSFLRNCY